MSKHYCLRQMTGVLFFLPSRKDQCVELLFSFCCRRCRVREAPPCFRSIVRSILGIPEIAVTNNRPPLPTTVSWVAGGDESTIRQLTGAEARLTFVERRASPGRPRCFQRRCCHPSRSKKTRAVPEKAKRLGKNWRRLSQLVSVRHTSTFRSLGERDCNEALIAARRIPILGRISPAVRPASH
jgi:hypothetical protein